jgi:hypothetical protein
MSYFRLEIEVFKSTSNSFLEDVSENLIGVFLESLIDQYLRLF